jgi:hypothetical protein
MTRLRPRLVPLLAALVLAACGSGPRSLGPDVKRGLALGARYAQRITVAGRTGTPDNASTLALGYLERVRLGLGSPFRTADYALHDPRLGDEVRQPLAWAILSRTLVGDAYRVDPAALDGIGSSPAGFQAGAGRYHLELIEGAIQQAGDPRAGELAVRLAYSLAAAEGSVWRRAPGVVAQAAALVRDRELARADALRLLQAARREGVDPLELMVRWRAGRRFAVEAPRLAELPASVEREALELAPPIALAIRQLAPRLAGVESTRTPAGPGSTPLLGPAAARRLLQLADSIPGPPETPVVVALGVHAAEILAPADLSQDERTERERMLADAVDAERFTAHLDLALDHRGEGDAGLASARLGVATALRSYAQEEVWFPGFGGPSARELADHFGIAVSFDGKVPQEWRPYFRRMLGQSLEDLQRVMPAMDFRGLRVRFGPDPLGPEALALHDPRRRIIYLPPASGAGTIAHELAHDLDWQGARRLYGVRGGYATDIASRHARDPLASSVSGLSTLPTPGRREQYRLSHLRRPAEAFARNVEWFVANALARDGIMDGYLSSVQDEVLTGYGSVQPPELTGAAGRALVEILDQVAPVYRETRDWYLQAYGPARVLGPFDLLRRVLETSVAGDAAHAGAGRLQTPAAADSTQPPADGYPAVAAFGFDAVQRSRLAGLAAIDAWACAAPGAMYDRDMETRRRDLVALAAAARARGLAARIAGRTAGRQGWLWMRRRLYGAPWPEAVLDSISARTLAPVVDAAQAADTTGLPPAGDVFALTLPAHGCNALVRSSGRWPDGTPAR